MLKIIQWTDQWSPPDFIILFLDLNFHNVIFKGHLFQASQQWGSQAETTRRLVWMSSGLWGNGQRKWLSHNVTFEKSVVAVWWSYQWLVKGKHNYFVEQGQHRGTIGQSVTPLYPETSLVRIWWAHGACEYINCIQPPCEFLLWIKQSHLSSFNPGYFFPAFCLVKVHSLRKLPQRSDWQGLSTSLAHCMKTYVCDTSKVK